MHRAHKGKRKEGKKSEPVPAVRSTLCKNWNMIRSVSHWLPSKPLRPSTQCLMLQKCLPISYKRRHWLKMSFPKMITDELLSRVCWSRQVYSIVWPSAINACDCADFCRGSGAALLLGRLTCSVLHLSSYFLSASDKEAWMCTREKIFS